MTSARNGYGSAACATVILFADSGRGALLGRLVRRDVRPRPSIAPGCPYFDGHRQRGGSRRSRSTLRCANEADPYRPPIRSAERSPGWACRMPERGTTGTLQTVSKAFLRPGGRDGKKPCSAPPRVRRTIANDLKPLGKAFQTTDKCPQAIFQGWNARTPGQANKRRLPKGTSRNSPDQCG